ncbi:SymE family type I addiction module toxin [Spirosoma sordidisoli]|uniref:Type I addiction module toxin, SymE family n=1 Tax=Spirosoma sordidisoli TaxID=2502893 RepID=A0A4Q2ULI8_9BACT|nr:SymE family type I addiction module toxin [Spirosoma sordidisoli]RYC70086.1 type I addiction module toxin, SymE family [Spirosoma sordidisoli]
MTRTKKIQSRCKVSGRLGQRVTTITPLLELSGDWFRAAGFTPGQLASITVCEGVITIVAQ